MELAVRKMKKIEWQKSLETGISDIDLQHKQIIDQINRLIDLMDSGQEFRIQEKAMEDLLQLFLFHFSYEHHLLNERVDRRVDADHRKEHEKKLEEFNFLLEKVQNRTLVINEQMLQYLVKVTLEHILIQDKRDFSSFIPD